jgi:nitrate/nitrite transporter NarK
MHQSPTALLISSLFFVASFQLGSASAIVPYTIVLSFIAGFVPTSAFTLAPETMPDPRWAGLALGIVSVGQNTGVFFGPPLVGNLIAGGDWAAGALPLVIVVAIGVAASVWLNIRQTQSQAAKIEMPAT